MASKTALAQRAITNPWRLATITTDANGCAINPARRALKAKRRAMGLSGKSFRRYRLALRRDYAAEAALSD